jgi:hypothetical protein
MHPGLADRHVRQALFVLGMTLQAKAQSEKLIVSSL